MAAVKLKISAGAEPYPGYRLSRFLGKGSWGEVWEALKPDGGTLALKFLSSDSGIVGVQEIRALQAIRDLKHPNLLRLENVWSCVGYLVIVMERAEGSLLDLLDICTAEDQTPIPPEMLCDFLSQAATAIDFLNQQQHLVDGQRVAFRHGDIKPSNLLMVDGTLKVADFGLTVMASAPRAPSHRAGTLAYAAPEAFQGWRDERSDQFALAASYYHLRTGKLPFPNVPKAFDDKYVHPTPDMKLLKEAENAILTRALARMAKGRWPSCGEFMEKMTRCFAPAG